MVRVTHVGANAPTSRRAAAARPKVAVWHNRQVVTPKRFLGAALLLLVLALAFPQVGRAQGRASAALRVAVRVAPVCSIFTNSPETDRFAPPSIRLLCGRTALRAIRVSTDSGEDVVPMPGPAARQWLSAGEVVFSLPTVLATVASRDVLASLPRQSEPTPVVVTLNF